MFISVAGLIIGVINSKTIEIRAVADLGSA
jgi:hypothetical protein